MGKKLLEKDGAEMASALVSLATPIRNFLEDAEFQETFRACTKRGIRNKMEGILNIYADMTPLLFGDKHLKDTLSILAIIEGTTVSKMLKMNGVEMIADAMKAWEEQIKPFFTQLGLTESAKL